MLVCRPFFKNIIFHWQNAGLARWLETAVQIRTRSFTYRLMKNADLSIVPSDGHRRTPRSSCPSAHTVLAITSAIWRNSPDASAASKAGLRVAETAFGTCFRRSFAQVWISNRAWRRQP